MTYRKKQSKFLGEKDEIFLNVSQDIYWIKEMVWTLEKLFVLLKLFLTFEKVLYPEIYSSLAEVSH